MGGLDPVDDLIVLAETPDPDRLRSLPVLERGVAAMGTEVNAPRADGHANDRMQLQAEELGQVRICAIQTISDDNVVRTQQMVESLHDQQFMVTHRRRDQI